MRPDLVVAVAQPECVPYDVPTNADRHAAAIRAAHARVVVFPELSLTGYHLDAPAVAPDDVALAPITAACAETGALALVGAPTTDGDGRDHIAMFAIDPLGVRVAYRKMCVHSTEAARFVAGDRPAALTIDGWRLGLGICRDTGIQEQVEATVALGIDAYVAGVVDAAADAQDMIDRSRRIARDQSVWVAVASFAGSTGEGYDDTAGRSRICAPGGAVVGLASAAPGEILRHVLA